MAQETQMLKGILQGCILVILSGGEMYGYIIVESLKKYGFEDINEARITSYNVCYTKLLRFFINYTTSWGHPWFVYPTFAVLWWPLAMFFTWLNHRKN